MLQRNLTALVVLVCLLAVSARTLGVDRRTPRKTLAAPHAHIPFIANEGQQHKDVLFYAQTFGGTVFVTHAGRLVYSLPAALEVSVGRGVALSEQLLGHMPCRIAGLAPNTGTVSYFVGGNPAEWKARIATYNSVDLGEVYPGIRLQLEAHCNNVEKRFVVEPGAEPADIRLQFDGVQRLTIGATGELEAHTPAGLVNFTRPVAYQEGICSPRSIEVAYWIEGNDYGFSVGDYDHERALIIDPLLASTFLGGSGHDGAARGASVALDADGNVYVVSTTTSLDFPTTDGAYDEEHSGAGQADVCISKLDSDLTTLLASTFLGGSSDELADRQNYIVVNGDGDVYVAGRTESPDFPTIPGAFDATYHGGGDVYVSKLSSDLSNLLASTLIGGPEKDEAGSLSVDGTGNVYVAGYTRSTAFPVTSSAYQPTHHGNGPWPYGGDIFIAKFTSDLSTLSASTFLGGSDLEDHGIVVPAPDGRIYVAGSTCSDEFPTTPGAFNTARPGTTSIFISSFSSDLSALHASTFVGGNTLNVALGMTLDDSGIVYVTGLTTSTDFPTTPGAYSQTYSGIGGHELGDDVYVIKLNDQLTTLLAGTYLGGTGYEVGWRVALDSVGNVYVAGVTTSLDLPTTFTSFQSRFAGGATRYDAGVGGDGWVAKLSSDFSTLLASTYLGTSDCDYLSALAVGSEGGVYVAGATESASFPTTPGAFDESYNGGSTNPFGGDIFVSKVDGLLSADCNSNGLPDMCDVDCQAVAGECNIPGCGGSEDGDGNGWPDECCLVENVPLSEDPQVPKNRYLSFTIDGTDDVQAVQVTFVALPEYTYANGRKAWVQEPVAVTEYSGSTDDLPLPNNFTANLGCEPYYTNWSALGVIDVYDGGIVPGASYEIRAIAEGCDTANALLYSSALPVGTSVTGDVVGNSLTPPPPSPPQGVVDFNDIAGLVDKFKNVAGAPRKARADIINSSIDEAPPDHKIDFMDISYCVDAFRNREAPLPGPPVVDPCG